MWKTEHITSSRIFRAPDYDIDCIVFLKGGSGRFGHISSDWKDEQRVYDYTGDLGLGWGSSGSHSYTNRWARYKYHEEGSWGSASSFGSFKTVKGGAGSLKIKNKWQARFEIHGEYDEGFWYDGFYETLYIGYGQDRHLAGDRRSERVDRYFDINVWPHGGVDFAYQSPPGDPQIFIFPHQMKANEEVYVTVGNYDGLCLVSYVRSNAGYIFN